MVVSKRNWVHRAEVGEAKRTPTARTGACSTTGWTIVRAPYEVRMKRADGQRTQSLLRRAWVLATGSVLHSGHVRSRLAALAATHGDPSRANFSDLLIYLSTCLK